MGLGPGGRGGGDASSLSFNLSNASVVVGHKNQGGTQGPKSAPKSEPAGSMMPESTAKEGLGGQRHEMA